MREVKDLFYSESEKILFWIVGYIDNSDNVVEILHYLTKYATFLSDIAGNSFSDIKTLYIFSSRRYENMRVFYTKVDKIPEDVSIFNLNDEWTMMKWLFD